MRRPQLTPSLATTLLVILQLKIPETASLGKAGDPCTTSRDCDQLNLLSCDSKSTCACARIRSVPLHYFKGSCLSYVDGPCSKVLSKDGPNIHCVEHGLCVKVNPDPQETNGKCFCKEGYYRTVANLCSKNLPPSSNALHGGGIETPNGGKGEAGDSKYPQPYHHHSIGGAPPSVSKIPAFVLVLGLITSLIVGPYFV